VLKAEKNFSLNFTFPLTGMVLRAHICVQFFTSFLAGYEYCTISQISWRGAPFWKALLLGYNTHPLDFNEACVKKDLDANESQWM